MQTIYGRNMHQIIPQALELLLQEGDPRGHMTENSEPVSMMVTAPAERLSYGTGYDLNPFAALFNALWVIGGRNDVEFLSRFDSYQTSKSDDGQTLHGAYGRRVREHFQPEPEGDETFPIHGIDQLKSVIMMLRNNPGHKAAVISLWDAGADMGLQSRNLPAATQLYFSINHGQGLDMMVTYRDADIFDVRLDAIAFSMMQQFIAAVIPVALGRMSIVTNWLGAETTVLDAIEVSLPEVPLESPYRTDVDVGPLVSTDSDAWLAELAMFLDEGPVMGMRDPFFRHVAAPMWQAWGAYKSTAGLEAAGANKALEIVARVRASDWQAAARSWLHRRIDERA